MSLLTPQLVKRFAGVGRQEGQADPLVLCRFRVFSAPATWYMLEYEPVDRTFFGWANLTSDPDGWELGYASRDELEELDFGSGLKISVNPPGITVRRFWIYRDEKFQECRLSAIQELPSRCAALHAEAARQYRQESGDAQRD